ncbi:MAG TPA: ABC transporter substrate-binding protein [Candidatus Acidoferrales bacterium]|nr:ABC transporter substrate-binding protein [Candidatus Acidoferrales bacterium]
MILSRTFRLLSIVAVCLFGTVSWAQMERAVITHNSESITIAPIVYGIERGFYRREGLDLEFRFIRADLAAAAIAGSQELDYMISSGTAFRAAVRGLPLKILAYSFKKPLFYLLSQPSITSIKELKGKKIAVSSPQDSGGLSAKAAIRAGGLDPIQDVVYIAIGAASVRMAAMEAGSVSAAIMPVPWNLRMKRKGFPELSFAGGLLSEPLTGIVTSAAKVEKNPEQIRKMLRGYLRSLRALRHDKNDVVQFIGQRFNLDAESAADVYKIMLDTMSEDGTVANAVMERVLEDNKKEAGVKRSIALTEIVDYRFLKEISQHVEK